MSLLDSDPVSTAPKEKVSRKQRWKEISDVRLEDWIESKDWATDIGIEYSDFCTTGAIGSEIEFEGRIDLQRPKAPI